MTRAEFQAAYAALNAKWAATLDPGAEVTAEDYERFMVMTQPVVDEWQASLAGAKTKRRRCRCERAPSPLLLKFNPNHGPDGRFSSGPGGGGLAGWAAARTNVNATGGLIPMGSGVDVGGDIPGFRRPSTVGKLSPELTRRMTDIILANYEAEESEGRAADGYAHQIVHGLELTEQLVPGAARLVDLIDVQVLPDGVEGCYMPRTQVGKVLLLTHPALMHGADATETVVHEMGHGVGESVFKNRSTSRRLAPFNLAVAQTLTLQRVRDLTIDAPNRDTAEFAAYLNQTGEIWARAWTQHVAVKTKDPALVESVRHKVEEPETPLVGLWYWEPGEFATVDAAITAVVGG